MKKYFLFIAIIASILVSCKPDPEKPSVVTLPVTEITESTAVSGGNVTSDGGAEVTARGVCWGTNQNPTTDDNKTVDGSGIGEFTSNINELSDSTTYYVRAYATNSEGTSYGEEYIFTTLNIVDGDDGDDGDNNGDDNEGDDNGDDNNDEDDDNEEVVVELPVVATLAITEITETSAIAGGEIASDGGAEVTARGVCWSINQNPTIENDKTVDGSGVGSFTSNITGLTQNTTYYVRAYATNSEGTSYGEEVSFTTLEEVVIVAPTVVTLDVTEVAQTTAVSGGDVTSDGGSEVYSRGICWGVNPNPTLDDDFTTNGDGLGEFTCNIVNLTPNTKYYVRAFATNSVGTSFGEQVEFTTLEVEEDGTINGYEYVDLGLPSGLKWATHNIGATSPSEKGDMFAWGEISPKAQYTEANCTSYGLNMQDIAGDPQYDAARANCLIRPADAGHLSRQGKAIQRRAKEGNMTNNYLTPKDAAAEMGISVATITRCVKNGAPVHRWGSTGYRYRIDVNEFVRWMERQGAQAARDRDRAQHYDPYDMEAMAARRRAAIRAL